MPAESWSRNNLLAEGRGEALMTIHAALGTTGETDCHFGLTRHEGHRRPGPRGELSNHSDSAPVSAGTAGSPGSSTAAAQAICALGRISSASTGR
jgi:hypothetical protein